MDDVMLLTCVKMSSAVLIVHCGQANAPVGVHRSRIEEREHMSNLKYVVSVCHLVHTRFLCCHAE